MRKDIKTIVEHAVVSEKAIEAYLVKRVTAAGCLCLKYTNPNMVGYPDRLVVEPNGLVQWVELKSKGQHPSPIQLVRFGELRDLGHEIFVCSSRDDVDKFIRQL
jgi:hypothetical protein